MPERIPVEAAKRFAEEQQLRQLIIACWDGERTHIVTYGGSAEDSDQAAEGGNQIKDCLGWPDDLRAESPKVASLKFEVEQLRWRLKRLVDHWNEFSDQPGCAGIDEEFDTAYRYLNGLPSLPREVEY